MKDNPFSVANKYLSQPIIQKRREMEVQTIPNEDDPILSVDEWQPIFLDYHQKVTRQVADCDIWGWSRIERPELYRQLKAAESEFDNLSKSSVHISEVMKAIRRWGDLVLQVQFEQQEKPKPEQGKLNVVG